MQGLLKKIEASADSRLRLPPGRRPAEEINRFKGFLKVESHRLKIEHRRGGDGLAVCNARSFVLDLLLRSLWDHTKASLSEQARKEFPRISLVAIGGYGRGELSPQSDIDFMFLHNRQVMAHGIAHPYLARMIDGVLYSLWDLGLKVGYSIRSVEDCVKVAASDMQAKTSLVEARLIVGDKTLFQKFWSTFVNKSVDGTEEAYIASRLEDQDARRSKFGNSASMQEPNVKNGCGGLRDFQNLLWMTFFKYRTRSLRDLQEKDFLSVSERRRLEAAHKYLLRVRTEMHYLTNRAADLLTRSIQPTVAYNLGFTDRSPSRRIERFMRTFYTHTRAIFLLTRTLEQRMVLVPPPEGRFSFRKLLPRGRVATTEPVDGFRFVNGEICAASKRVFRDQPRRLMRVFLYAQQRGLRLHPDLAQLIRSQLVLVDRAFRSDEHARETFLTILNQRGNVAQILKAMHEVDFLGKYMPEFGRLTCLVQHEFYHQYAADEHTLQCLYQVDRIWEEKGRFHVNYTPLLQNLDRPYLLYLALLLHDVGKADGSRGHAQASAKRAMAVTRRLNLDSTATQRLRLVIEHHLEMASVSQRRDLDDPAVISHFARQVQDTEVLTLLMLLTFTDAQATSDQLWNGFKETLLWTLYRKTAALVTGGTEFIRAEEYQRELLQEEVRKELSKSISDEELAAHFIMLPARYSQVHSPDEIVEDLELAHRFMHLQFSNDHPLAPAVTVRQERDQGCTVVKVCTWDRTGLFSLIAGSLSASGLNILSARIFTRSDAVALDTLAIVDGRTSSPAQSSDLDRFEKLLRRVLSGEEVDLEGQIAAHKSAHPPYQGYTGERIATEVRLDNSASDSRTVIEVETEDHVGLLYHISQALTELNLDISAARVCTEKGAAIDTFYVSEADGGKVSASQRQKVICLAVQKAITRLEQK